MNQRRFPDHVVMVTGAGSGIGRATALRVASEGGIAVIADIAGEAARSVQAEIEAAGGRAESIVLDVTSREGWAEAAAELMKRHGRCDGLVNNAGITRDKSMLKMEDEDWQVAIDVNLRGVWLGCQAMVPMMKAEGRGTIVNLSSESRHGAFGQANYAAAKAGVIGLSRTVALEHARHGIRCNVVAPGTIETAMVLAVPEDIRSSWTTSIPLGRFGQPEEVAGAITFLLSEDASYVNGHVLAVDGGST